MGWQTRDGRFTIETASGTWSLVDAEQTDDLGLPLVRGPFRSLTEAKDAIEAARASEPAKLDARHSAPPRPSPPRAKPAPGPPAAAPRASPRSRAEPEEPSWMAALDSGDRRRARQLIDRLNERGVRDAEGVVRRDLAGDVPTVARVAVADRIAETLGDADAATVKLVGRLLDLLADDRDESLDVRWRLVDDAGRPVGVSADDVAAARKRATARQ